MKEGIIAVAACSGILILILVAAFSLSFLRSRSASRKLEIAFRGRPSLSYQEFHKQYFAEKGIPEFVSVGVRKVLESETRSDLSRLAGNDDFHGNLSFLKNAVDHPDTVNSLEKVFEIRIAESDVATMGAATVEDIVKLVWETLRANKPLKDPATIYFTGRKESTSTNGNS